MKAIIRVLVFRVVACALLAQAYARKRGGQHRDRLGVWVDTDQNCDAESSTSRRRKAGVPAGVTTSRKEVNYAN
jgi:hypothetical protein